MKPIVFAGPTLFGVDRETLLAQVEIRPPVRRGDVARAVEQGAQRIGIIDGLFGDQPSVGHKEILYALSTGVMVFGAASMGALRAAECNAFGMIGVGQIYRSYRFGKRSADADVAIVHAPAELGYQPLSVALVDVEASLAALKGLRLISLTEKRALLASARALHFSERSWRKVLEHAAFNPERMAQIGQALRDHGFSQKQRDALELLTVIGRRRMRKPAGAISPAELNDTGFLGG